MRKVTLQEAMSYFEDNNVHPPSIVAVKSYLLFRLERSEEWVYVELP